MKMSKLCKNNLGVLCTAVLNNPTAYKVVKMSSTIIIYSRKNPIYTCIQCSIVKYIQRALLFGVSVLEFTCMHNFADNTNLSSDEVGEAVVLFAMKCFHSVAFLL